MATYSASENVYYYWVTVRGTTTSATTDAWSNWCADDTSYSGTTTYYTDNVWESWIISNDCAIKTSKYEIPVTPLYHIGNVVTSPKLSRETKRARAVQGDINKIWRDIRIEEEKERQKQAEVTAMQLLEDLIGDEQLAHYKEVGSLLVKGRKADYVIEKGKGVYKVEKDKIINLCIHLKQRTKYPDTDNVIALKLLIEANEKEFLKTANSHGVVRNEDTKRRVLELVKRAA